jgi:HEPN domain-containing protein
MNEAERWLTFAREDLRVAELVLREAIYNQACFHAQQCVEKSLKALVAYFRKGAPPKTHDITDLVQLIPGNWLGNLGNDLSKLDDYYIPTRYPDALPGALPEGLPEQADAEEAVRLACDLVALVSQRVEKQN